MTPRAPDPAEPSERPRTVALVDGEHYPPVTLDALEHLRMRYDIVAVAMMGGGEKLAGALTLGDLPVVAGTDQRETLRRAIDEHAPATVFDLSDAPVIETRARLALACIALARGVAYHGADFTFAPPWRTRRARVPTIAVIGTGKRTGKTAVSAALARTLTRRGERVTILAMGRGGPAEPVVVHGAQERPSVDALLAIADAGEHAASDVYEDAVVAGVTAVGARRAGAGLAGATAFDTVEAALEAAEADAPDLIILEGSGTALPPVPADATVLVAGADADPAQITGGLGPLRLLIADLVVVTMAEDPVLSSETLSALTSSASEFARGVPIVRTVFRPAPMGSVTGKRILYATTAPRTVGAALRRHLEEAHGATVAGVTHSLADRPTLSQEIMEMQGTFEVLLTEVKAAAIDVAARAARSAGAEVMFCDNEPIALDGDLDDAFVRLRERAVTA